MLLEDKIIELLNKKSYVRENKTTKFFDRICNEFLSSINEIDLSNDVVVRNIYFRNEDETDKIDYGKLAHMCDDKHMSIEFYANYVRVSFKLFEIKAIKLIK